MHWLQLNPETLRSRTFWTALAAMATAVTTLDGPERILAIIAALSSIFMRDAVATPPADHPGGAAPSATGAVRQHSRESAS